MPGIVPIRTRASTLLSLLLVACFSIAAAPDVNSLPKPTGYTSDLAHVISEPDKQRLDAFCQRVDQQLGVQFALVTIDTLGDTPIDTFTIDLARVWGVGAKQTNQGILVLLVIKDRKSRVEIGRGVEPYVTDGFAGRTLRSMRPDLQASNYGAAFLEGARAMAAEVAQGKGVAFSGDDLGPGVPPERVNTRGGRGIALPQIVFGIILLLFIIRLFGRGGRGGGGRGGGGGFWTGFLLSSLLNSGGRSGGWNGGGGGGFGGDSGGGGGFGGFGGGDFGGGGASSDW